MVRGGSAITTSRILSGRHVEEMGRGELAGLFPKDAAAALFD